MTRILESSFLVQILDTISDSIAVVNEQFSIVFVNQAWTNFACNNGLPQNFNWIDTNYLMPVQTSAMDGDEFAIIAINGIEELRSGRTNEFTMEYPCHSPDVDRWFIMSVTQFQEGDDHYYVISHRDITTRVILELKNRQLARLDPLTGIANRRAFEEFFNSEWMHCRRSRSPISIAILDLDNFKEINDQFGHSVGDECLQRVARILSRYTARASDSCARIGGEEFVAVWGGTTGLQAQQLAETILNELRHITFEKVASSASLTITASIGVLEADPMTDIPDEIINAADDLMYTAKRKGKNQVQSNLNSI